MKKCPTCEKTFDDNLKFCQTDGTPLVAVEEQKPEDPYKTTVANASELPIPPLDPFKTMVASPPPAEEPKSEVKEDVPSAEEDVDAMKTIVSSDVPKFEPVLKPESKEEPKTGTPPSPFNNAPAESKEDDLKGLSTALPQPPKFNEPSLNPPSFGDSAPKSEPPVQTPSEPVAPEAPKSSSFDMNQPKPKSSGDLSGDSPYGDTKNAPIPSPFDLSMPPGYQIPSAPMPPYKEAEIEEVKAEALNTPFADEVKENQQIEQQNWTPPPSPNANWQEQQIGQNTPFQPPPSGVQGENKTLAIVSLVLGILSIPCCGFLSGIPAVIVGFMAKSRAESTPHEFGGRGLALAGIITGIIGTVLSIILTVLQIVLGGLANLGNF